MCWAMGQPQGGRACRAAAACSLWLVSPAPPIAEQAAVGQPPAGTVESWWGRVCGQEGG